MAKGPRASLQLIASKKALQILIALLFVAMGIIGFSSGRGTGGELSREISNIFGGDREFLLYVLSTIELVCGIFLGAAFFVPSMPANFVKIAMTSVWVIWLALIVILDFLTIDFGRFDGSGWFVWIEQVVLHLIVLAGITQIQE